MKKWKKAKWYVISLCLALTWSLACFVVTYLDVFEGANGIVTGKVYSSYREDENVNIPIKLIQIDDVTERMLGESETWSRQIYADALNFLNSGEIKPAVIGFDILFNKESDQAGDTKFVEACIAAGNVCLIAANILEPEYEGFPVMENELVYPYDEIKEHVTIGVADIFMQYGKSGESGAQRIYMEENDIEIDSFPMALYKIYQKYLGYSNNIEEKNLKSIILTSINPDKEYDTYSFSDIISERVDLTEFSNSIIIIGKDINEIKRQAGIVESMLTQKYMRKLPSLTLGILYGILIFLFYYVIFLGKKKNSLLICITIFTVHFFVGRELSNQGYYLPVVQIWLFMAVALVSGLLVNYFRERSNTQNLQKVLATYVEADVVDHILEHEDFDLALTSERRDIAVMFIDIRGFTSLSESLQPEQIVEILNRYLSVVSEKIKKHGGNVDKFIGDAAMAIYNAPKDLDDYIFKAVSTATDILEESKILREEFFSKYGKEIEFGVGIHCGTAVVGNIGCESRMDYTAIGDTVNTASRLESSAKAGQILISRKVYENVKDYVEVEYVGSLTLKGKTEEIETYNVKKTIKGR